ncbi:MAG TPA: prepilin-type N-terminal cleavage/methylation domain-containing protein [Phycisphaerae bacterium]|nr:prepilin-type N-terminal cleavage/methylation domain-containing protein [Phycisphaerae bacterium]
MKSKTNKYGFTLVELLVVVSIIALLISILLPSLKRARDQAKQVVCASQQKQIANALWNYWTENEGHIPEVISPMTNGVGADGFGDQSISDEDIDPFYNPKRGYPEVPSKTVWAQSLPNVLMPTHMGEDEKAFRCPAAIVGWPRNEKPFRMTYRCAAANQPNGDENLNEESPYFKEHFGFMDGRIYKIPKPAKQKGKDPIAIIRFAEDQAAARGTFLRDMVRPVGPELIGPHNGGNVVINKRMEVEVRSKKTINEDLAPAGTGAVKF